LNFKKTCISGIEYNELFPKPGIYTGSYGGHGKEFLLIHYLQDCFIATKITGDVNVPRGEVSFQSNLQQARFLYPNIDIVNSTEFPNGRVYDGFGTIAMPGYLDTQQIPINST
jgi:hypothetical protein